MASDLIAVRLPTGTEYRLSDKTPKIGDVLKRNGDNWVVVSIEERADGTTAITLRPGLKPHERSVADSDTSTSAI